MACVFKGKEVLHFSSLWVIKAAEEGARSISSLQEIYDFPRNYYLYCILGNRLTSVS